MNGQRRSLLVAGLRSLYYPLQTEDDTVGLELKNRAIPTSASNSNRLFFKELQIPETASASESASEIKTVVLPDNYPGTTRQPLVMAGFAARRV